MPVIGHAFVGIGTAMCTKTMLRPSLGATLWSPIVVVLAYLPDILNQVAMLGGGGDISIVTHSICFAIIGSLLLGFGLAKLGMVSVRGGVVICFLSLAIHDVLDLMQSTNRQPWWPISDRLVGGAWRENPISPMTEAVWFGVAFAVFLAGRSILKKRRGRQTDDMSKGSSTPNSVVWVNRTLIVLILFAASATHYLRNDREKAYTEVRQAIEQHQYTAALAAAERAERWPSTAKPGRLNYARGEIYTATGDRGRAEAAFAKAFMTDPCYFWGLADMAAFYASSGEPAAARRQRVEPFLKRLKQEFADHEALPRNLARIERKLNRP